MEITDQLFSALVQVGVVLGLSAITYGIHWLFFRRHLNKESFFSYIGLRSATKQVDRLFILFWLGIIAFAILSTFLEFQFSEEFRKIMTNETSPYGKILKNSFGFKAMALGLIYCFIMASGSEEILFRGLIAKRLFSWLGLYWGNIIQALIFWLMHLVMFRLITGEWISLVQLVIILNSFGMGLVLGYANFRKGGQSILPSWILHGSMNFSAFLTLAFLW